VGRALVTGRLAARRRVVADPPAPARGVAAEAVAEGGVAVEAAAEGVGAGARGVAWRAPSR